MGRPVEANQVAVGDLVHIDEMHSGRSRWLIIDVSLPDEEWPMVSASQVSYKGTPPVERASYPGSLDADEYTFRLIEHWPLERMLAALAMGAGGGHRLPEGEAIVEANYAKPPLTLHTAM